jgi:hypothetical protein
MTRDEIEAVFRALGLGSDRERAAFMTSSLPDDSNNQGRASLTVRIAGDTNPTEEKVPKRHAELG